MSLIYGPAMPDARGASFVMGPAYPDYFDFFNLSFGTVPGVGAPGAAVFAFNLESGTAVTYGWATDVFKSYSGKERRASRLESPREMYSGSAVVAGDDVRTGRAALVRFASLGVPFRIGMAWEELTLIADAVDDVVSVPPGSIAATDWATLPGQRVIIMAQDGSSITGVIQDSDSGAGTITLDVEPGDTGIAFGRIMPTSLVYLEPTQGFARYARGDVVVEKWKISARAGQFGFSSSALRAELSLEPPQTNSGILDDVKLVARIAGEDGNDIQVKFSADGITSAGEIEEDVDAKTLHIHFEGDVSTIEELLALLAVSELVAVVGTGNLADVLATGDDEFNFTPLAGGVDAEFAEVGVGAVVATHDGHPVWDRGIDSGSEVGDSVQLLSHVIDLGGIPFTVGDAPVPDWGRAIVMARTDRAEQQWLRRFMDAIRGRWKSFWLPTWRDDLVYVSRADGATTTLTVTGDVAAWYPAHVNLQVFQVDGTVTYAGIASVVDNGDGTSDVELDALLSAEDPAVISWMELCRMESDELTVTFKDAGFSFSAMARVVQR